MNWKQRMWQSLYSVYDVLPFTKKYRGDEHLCKPVKKPHPVFIHCQYCNKGFINTKRFIRTGGGCCPFCYNELIYRKYRAVGKRTEENEVKMLAYITGVLLKVTTRQPVDRNDIETLQNIADELGSRFLTGDEFRCAGGGSDISVLERRTGNTRTYRIYGRDSN